VALLTAIAGIVTPLGIYQTLAPTDSIQTPFNYIHDDSPFGIGTPGRSTLGFNRVCFTYDNNETADSRPIPCPFSDTVDIVSLNANGSNSSFPYGYDVSIPQILLGTYSSGTGNSTTVSNFFDIQWRQYTATVDPTNNFNNGSIYLVGVYRGMQTLALDNTTEAVEGLVVDTVSGGIGFRNRMYGESITRSVSPYSYHSQTTLHTFFLEIFVGQLLTPLLRQIPSLLDLSSEFHGKRIFYSSSQRQYASTQIRPSITRLETTRL